MPEGDTLHRTATRLRPALAGFTLVRFEAPRLRGDAPALGTRIHAVESKGKNLLVHFDGGLSLRTHLMMSGSWHLYEEGQRWRKGAHLARAVLGADSGWVAVCFSAPTVETYRRDIEEPPPLAGLGPDLCEPDADLDAGVARMAQLADHDTEIAESLLDQRVVAGIGNVFKSETLFAAAVNPFATTASLDETTRRRLLEIAHRQLLVNLGSGPRVTHPKGLAVYGRQGSPCHTCGAPIRMKRQGVQARSTYWCPRCQPATTSDP